MSKAPFVLGTRGSPLALWQTEQVKLALQACHPELQVEIEIIHTKGDKILDKPLAAIGDKGLFTQELEEALHEGRIQGAVHSLKDLPTDLPEGLSVAAVLPRQAPEDVLISRVSQGLADLPQNALVGTGSSRRKNQLMALRPDLRIEDLRGNIQTRLKKLWEGQYDAIIMARAALERMDLGEHISHVFEHAEMLPAVGQGVIAIEVAHAHDALTLFKGISDPQTWSRIQAERAFLKALGGGCEKPIAGFAHIQDQTLLLSGYISSMDGTKSMYDSLVGQVEQPVELGERLAQKMLSEGGQAILK